MVVLVTCTNEDPIENEGASMFTTLYIIFRHARADNSGVGSGIWPKFVQAFIYVLVTCKNEDD